MAEYTGLCYFEGSAFKEISHFHPDELTAGTGLYEVLRVYSGICLFFEDHVRRLNESVSLSGYKFHLEPNHLNDVLNALIARNKIYNGNIRIVLHFKGQEPPTLYVYSVPHFYPTPAMYKTGVPASLFNLTRLHPNIKRIQRDNLNEVTGFISRHHVYEAILVDRENRITEGSKSNIFFIQGDIVYTPPSYEVLKGITRDKLFEICNKLNYKLIEKSISIHDLNQFNSAFLTGTSPKVLPLKCIDAVNFEVRHPVMQSLQKAYDQMIVSYLKNKE
jgi:branched-chain amino acid aminotransferase